MTLNLKKSTSEKDILELFKAVQARQENRSVIRITDEPLISVDYLKDDHSCIIDTRWLMLNQESHLKVVLWYDNEWGYSSRVADTVGLMARRNG
jgi:glyceraldehyde 3-phosphate dehydrogenase